MLRSTLRSLPLALSLLAACITATGCLLRVGISFADTTRDPRVALPSHAHTWQDSIGRLEVPVTRFEHGQRRHFTEHCSAVVVSPGPSPLIITAWHCLDGYESLIEPIRLTLNNDSTITLQIVASGGSMRQDWALLRATQPIVTRYWIPVSPQPLEVGAKISAVGYAPAPMNSDTLMIHSDQARQLLADKSCVVVDTTTAESTSTCVARQGASGGAILSRTASGSVRLAGIISAGDGHSVSVFYPTSSLLQRIRSLR